MTWHRQVFLSCDGPAGDGRCPDGQATGEYDSDTVAEARALARRLRWVRRDGKDLCERCAERLIGVREGDQCAGLPTRP